MKPRLESAQWTWEDVQIWIGVNERFGCWVTGAYCESDRRDADLMFEAEDVPSRSVVLVPRQGRNVTWAEAIDVRQGNDRL
jgi:hypothetical protein